MIITEGLSEYISERLKELDSLGIDYSKLEMDHFAYQCSSKEDYEEKKESSKRVGELKKEVIVDNRRVAIFENKCPIQIGNYLVSAFELIEPKVGQTTASQLNHIEFIIPSFDEFQKKYPNVNWDIRAVDRKEFPKLSIQLNNGNSIKFHLKNILEEM